MLIGIGTAREQWRDAGIEVYFGRIDAQELHELGERLFDEDSRERFREDELRAQVRQAENEADGLRDDLEAAERDARHLERERDQARKERDELRKQVAELERTIRGQTQTITELEGRKQ
ncbi:MAG TPA: hypothetical protein VGE74_13040 [Gemmata sp.]